MLLGGAISHYLVHLVTRTINDLYFVLTVTRLVIEPLVLVKGCVIGLGVTLLAALAPALEAAHSTPAGALRRSLLERRVRTGLRWLALAGAAALLAGWWLLQIPRYGLGGGLSGLFLVIGGYSALIPGAVWLMTRVGDRLMRQRGPLTRYALRGIGADLSRTGLAVTALTVAVAATLGVGIMITSFRATVSDWLNYTLTGDLYVSARSTQLSGSDTALPPRVRALIDALPGVAETSSARRVNARSNYGPVQLLALEPATRSHRGFRFTSPPSADLWPRFRRGELVLVSEPYARRHALQTGSPLMLHTPTGPHRLVVGGVFYDYGSDHGLISLVRSSYARWWQDDSVSTIGVFLRPGVSSASLRAALGSALGDAQRSVQIRSSGEIRAQSLRIFDRTFAVTQVLRLLAVAVAFVGVFSALLALQLERTREQAVLRASGVTTGQLAKVTLLQTATMGLYAGLLSLPLGWLMSRVLIEVINRRAFGWSIETQVPAAALPEALLLALVAALLAGVYPVLRMRRMRPALALREE
jgi:putative ABC transport system permease protein